MKYRGHWEIVASTMGYDWYHEDFDGAPMDYDGPPADRRYGWDLSVAYAQSSIDEFIIDYHWPVRERAELTYRTEHSREESRRLRADLLRAEWVRRPRGEYARVECGHPECSVERCSRYDGELCNEVSAGRLCNVPLRDGLCWYHDAPLKFGTYTHHSYHSYLRGDHDAE